MIIFLTGLYFVFGLMVSMHLSKTMKHFRASYIPILLFLWLPFLITAIGMDLFEYIKPYFNKKK